MGNNHSLFCCKYIDVEESVTDTQEEKYEDKYLNKFEQLSMDKNRVSFQNNYVFEMTPLGNVIMSYDSDDNVFNYYSDRPITNTILETVAQKYVIQYSCKYIYHIPHESEETSKEETKQPEISDVYGKFKSKHQHAMKNNFESNINKYKYLGRLCDFNILKRENKEHNKKEMSYKDFIKLNKIK